MATTIARKGRKALWLCCHAPGAAKEEGEHGQWGAVSHLGHRALPKD